MKKTVAIAITIIFNIAIDQITKVIARLNLDPGKKIQIIGDYLVFIRVENRGAFLGILSDLPEVMRTIVLSVLPTIAIIWFLVHIIRDDKMSRLMVIGVSFMLGGGIGNLYDRIVYGSVTDFLHIDLGFTQTGIFNVADMSIMAGGGLVLLEFFKNRKKNTTEKKEVDA